MDSTHAKPPAHVAGRELGRRALQRVHALSQRPDLLNSRQDIALAQVCIDDLLGRLKLADITLPVVSELLELLDRVSRMQEREVRKRLAVGQFMWPEEVRALIEALVEDVDDVVSDPEQRSQLMARWHDTLVSMVADGSVV